MAIAIEQTLTDDNAFASGTAFDVAATPAGTNRGIIAMHGVRSPSADPPFTASMPAFGGSTVGVTAEVDIVSGTLVLTNDAHSLIGPAASLATWASNLAAARIGGLIAWILSGVDQTDMTRSVGSHGLQGSTAARTVTLTTEPGDLVVGLSICKWGAGLTVSIGAGEVSDWNSTDSVNALLRASHISATGASTTISHTPSVAVDGVLLDVGITTTATDVLEDARVIALATAADAGGLFHANSFEPRFAELAISGVMAIHVLDALPDITRTRYRWMQARPLECLGDLDAGDAQALRVCAEHHLAEHVDYRDDPVEQEYGPEVASTRRDEAQAEVERAERVLAALDAERGNPRDLERAESGQ